MPPYLWRAWYDALNASVPPIFIYSYPNPQWDGLRRWDLGRGGDEVGRLELSGMDQGPYDRDSERPLVPSGM